VGREPTRGLARPRGKTPAPGGLPFHGPVRAPVPLGCDRDPRSQPLLLWDLGSSLFVRGPVGWSGPGQGWVLVLALGVGGGLVGGAGFLLAPFGQKAFPVGQVVAPIEAGA